LKPGEAVLAVAVESWKLIEFDIGPCSIRQIIYKGISFLKNQPENISLEDVVQAVNDKIYDSIEMNRLSIGRTQPILMALKCAYECKDSSSGDAWKIIFENQCGRKTDSIRMNVKKFAYQLYLELELACLEE
jgi:hypothetical protein